MQAAIKLHRRIVCVKFIRAFFPAHCKTQKTLLAHQYITKHPAMCVTHSTRKEDHPDVALERATIR
jgi:hypothetical protein